jgi:crossover junction endodeoxyribonuclease RusA
MSSIILTLPLPPTINNGYWKFHGHRRFLTTEAKNFKAEVDFAVRQANIMPLGKSRISLTVTLYFKDKRVNDLSNRIKALEDALVQSGLFDDDGQIDELYLRRGGILKGGKCEIEINIL